MIVSLQRMRPVWLSVIICGLITLPCMGCDDSPDTVQVQVSGPFPGSAGNEDNRPPSLSSLLSGNSGYREGTEESDVKRAEPDGCTDAALHISDTCGYDFTFDVTKVRCANTYEVCEAHCVSNTPCGIYKIFGRTNADNIAERNYNTCRSACYAQGSATCQDAEQRLRCCDSGEPKTKAPAKINYWNTDGYCNAFKTCEANCVMMAPSCDVLYNTSAKTAKSYTKCVDLCKTNPLEAAPLSYSPASYCKQFPMDPHCLTPAAPSTYVAGNECLDFPKSLDCTRTSNDNLETTYCETEPGKADIRCRKAYQDDSCPPLDKEPSVCATACARGSYYCAFCLCNQVPEICVDGGGAGSGGNTCTYYPYSRECSEDKYCTYNPGVGGCPR